MNFDDLDYDELRTFISSEHTYYLVDKLEERNLDKRTFGTLYDEIINGISLARAKEIEFKYLSKLDNVTHGKGYSQSDIKKHLGKL
jgi:hypothetical protein